MTDPILYQLALYNTIENFNNPLVIIVRKRENANNYYFVNVFRRFLFYFLRLGRVNRQNSRSFGKLIEWCFMPLSTVFKSYHGDSSHYSCLSWVSPVLGWALKCLAQGQSREKNPEDPGWLEPRTPGLRIKHFTTEPCRTPCLIRD